MTSYKIHHDIKRFNSNFELCLHFIYSKIVNLDP